MYHDDEPLGDEPYSAADRRKPGFDAYEAHLAWIKRNQERAARAPEEKRAELDAAIARVRAVILAAAAKPRVKTKRKRRCDIMTPERQARETAKQWKRAAADLKKRR